MRPRSKGISLTQAVAVFALVALAAVAGSAAATVRNVPADVATVQAALNLSTFGDVVLVAPGTYHENLIFSAARNGVRLASTAGPELTTLDGGSAGRVVTFAAGIGALTVIEGFTITHGGGATAGGGIMTINCSPTIRGNVIRDNQAAAAGGIYVDGGAPTIVDNRIVGNTATGGSGGGIYYDHFAAGTAEGNVVARNTCTAWGGGITLWEGSKPNLLRNSIVANVAGINGGGIYVQRNSHPVCTANIVAFHASGGGVFVQDFESTKIVECGDVFGNQPADYLGLPDPTGTSGNISADPLFCDLQAGDYGLTSLSPCSAAFSPSGCGLIGALDVACQPTSATHSTWGGIKLRYRGDPPATRPTR